MNNLKILIQNQEHFLQVKLIANKLGYHGNVCYEECYKYLVLRADDKGNKKLLVSRKELQEGQIFATLDHLYAMLNNLIKVNNQIVKFEEDCIKVGCKKVPYQTVKRIYKEAKKLGKL